MRQPRHNLKPFFNVVIIISALFAIVFCKMRLRDMHYEFLKKARAYGALKDDYYNNLMIQGAFEPAGAVGGMGARGHFGLGERGAGDFDHAGTRRRFPSESWPEFF